MKKIFLTVATFLGAMFLNSVTISAQNYNSGNLSSGINIDNVSQITCDMSGYAPTGSCSGSGSGSVGSGSGTGTGCSTGGCN